MRIRVFSINGNKVGNKPLTQEEEGETVTIDQRTEFDFVSSFVLVLLGIGADRGVQMQTTTCNKSRKHQALEWFLRV